MDHLIHSEWMDGKPVGVIVTSRASCKFIYRPTKGRRVLKCFLFRDYAYDYNAARIACYQARYQYSKEHALLSNEWREVADTNTGEIYAEVRLTGNGGGYTMLCDLDDLPFVEAHTWGCVQVSSKCVSVRTNVNSDGVIRPVSFHQMITEFEMVDHIDGKTLDNRKQYLDDTDYLLNNRNHMVSVKNTSGITGVGQYGKNVQAYWYDANRKRKSKKFSISKYSEAGAWALATSVRMAKEKEMGIRIRPRPRPDDEMLEERPKKRQRTLDGWVSTSL